MGVASQVASSGITILTPELPPPQAKKACDGRPGWSTGLAVFMILA
jgi:hypothetical protein